jgi:transcriptional regulator with XRE-family HTH domain
MAQTTPAGIPTIGTVIRAWRIFHGFTSTELAEKAGVRIGYLSEIEHDRTTNPKEKYLGKLAAGLELTLLDIYGRRMPPKDGEAEEEGKDAGRKEPEGRWRVEARSSQRASTSSTRLNAPVSTPYKEILEQRLAVLEKILRNAHEELREIGALVARMQEE